MVENLLSMLGEEASQKFLSETQTKAPPNGMIVDDELEQPQENMMSSTLGPLMEIKDMI